MDILDMIAISLIRGVGLKTMEMIQHFQNAEELMEQGKRLIAENFKPEAAHELCTNFSVYQKRSEEILIQLNRLNGRVTMQGWKDYPKRFAQGAKPPMLVYSVGDQSLFAQKNTMAIIGHRNSTMQEESDVQEFAKCAALLGKTVVSGLAIGIDTAAHKGAVAAGGKSIAVLPQLVPIYPKRNHDLAYQILEKGGLLVSEMMYQENIKLQLIQRNRLIVYLSDEVVVAGEKTEDGGTAYTIGVALKENKKVYIHKQGGYERLQ